MRYLMAIAALDMMPCGLPAVAQTKPASKAKLAAPAEPYSLSPTNRRDIIAQVKDKLLDGKSARWRWPKHVACIRPLPRLCEREKWNGRVHRIYSVYGNWRHRRWTEGHRPIQGIFVNVDNNPSS